MLRLFGLFVGWGMAVGGSMTTLLVLILAVHHQGLIADQAWCTLPSGTSCQQLSPHARAVVRQAIALQAHISGVNDNEYDLRDPAIRLAYQFWVRWCGSRGVPCTQAVSGNLQCVSFVNAVFALAGLPLPASGNGNDFWPLYAHQSGWLRIPATEYPTAERGLPLPGDLMVWNGGVHRAYDPTRKQWVWVEFGHVAVVIDTVWPQGSRDGSVTVAQANAPGNRWPAARQADPGNWMTLPLHPDRSVSTWPGYIVRGYLRPIAVS